METVFANRLAACEGEKSALQDSNTALEGEKSALEGEKSALQASNTALEGEKSALQAICVDKNSPDALRAAYEPHGLC